MRRTVTFLAAVSLTVGAAVFGSAGIAHADPSSNDWQALRLCESGDSYTMNSGNNYFGAYQFDLPTWKSVGGSGNPAQASKSEQDARALTLYRMRGWSPWICAALVGLTEDSDGGSGTKPSNPAPAPSKPAPSNPGSGSSTPKPVAKVAYPGKQLKEGSESAALAKFQKQLGSMGYGLEGTGYFGPHTKAAVYQLQAKAGLNVVGYVGPSTWNAAWDSKNKLSSTEKAAPAFPGGKIRKGAESSTLAKFQKQLGSFGYGLQGTGYFGGNTLAAVKKLQKKAGLHAVGFIGPETWYAAWDPANSLKASAPSKPAASKPAAKKPAAKYVPATNASCKVGSGTPLSWGGKTMVRGETYRDLQCFQRSLGSAYGLTGTGYFGPATAAAVAKLQGKAGLPKTGKVDQATWKAAWTSK